METKNIQDFLALAELGSSYAAAEKLFVSQSTLVRHIQSFEEEFGITLFDRTRTGFVLNEAGKTFLPYAKKIAFAQQQCYKALHHEDEESNVIKITAFGKIIDLLIDFKKKYPQYTLEYYHPEHADMKLREGLLDVVFMAGADNLDNELVLYPFMSIRMLAVVYDSHPLADRGAVSLEELKDEKFVAMTEDATFSDMFMEFFNKLGFTPDITATAPVGNDVLKMVEQKIGIALIHGTPEYAPSRPGLKILDIVPNIEYNIAMCYRNDGSLSKAAESFIRFAKKWKINNKDINQTLLE
ncbi:LysR family transcriptional regulator [Faecalicatena orotica]|uniref:LysR family transcriptional regulator n=1 Tax=Faecalicatena orotica TaxID=1544 RepID=UPI003217EA08